MFLLRKCDAISFVFGTLAGTTNIINKILVTFNMVCIVMYCVLCNLVKVYVDYIYGVLICLICITL